jgi:predicted HNH restriction endonuclease
MKQELPEIPELESASGGVDLSEFEGRKAKIESYEVMDGTSTFDENGDALPPGQTRPVKLLKVYTEQVTEFEKDGEKIPVSASELFNMKEQDGVWGISTHEKAKIQRLIKKLKAKSLKDIVGKDVVIRTRETSQGGTFLGFYID